MQYVISLTEKSAASAEIPVLGLSYSFLMNYVKGYHRTSFHGQSSFILEILEGAGTMYRHETWKNI